MGLNTQIYTNKIFDTVTVAASGTSANMPFDGINCQLLKVEGFFSAQILVTGSGTCNIGALCSNDGVNYYKPVSKSALTTPSYIATGLTATGGAGGDGKYIIKDPDVPLAGWLKFYITETGGANSVTVTMTLAFS